MADQPGIPPAASAPPASRPDEKSGSLTPVLLVASILALTVAVATWTLMSREVNSLRRDLTDLQDAHRELAQQVAQGRRGGSPIGQTIDVAGAPALGPADAVVTLIEYSDYECPFCIRHFQQTMPQIEANYVKSGKIRYVFRDFPIDQNHPQAIRAHEAARCAIEQNKFWELHPKLFSAPGTHTPALLDDRAREAGLDMPAFRACITSGRTTKPIRETAAVPSLLEATGTPWFFVGLRDVRTDKVRVLRPLGGAQPYQQFTVALDAALRESATR